MSSMFPPTAGPSASSHPLWSLLSGSNNVPNRSKPDAPALHPKDKSSTSIRILLNDTQKTLEGFHHQITSLTEEIGSSKRGIDEAGRLVEEGQEKATSDIKLLLTRMQVGVNKTLEQTNNAVSTLRTKLEVVQASVVAKQDNLQQQVHMLTQQLALALDQQKKHAEEQAKSQVEFSRSITSLLTEKLAPLQDLQSLSAEIHTLSELVKHAPSNTRSRKPSRAENIVDRAATEPIFISQSHSATQDMPDLSSEKQPSTLLTASTFLHTLPVLSTSKTIQKSTLTLSESHHVQATRRTPPRTSPQAFSSRPSSPSRNPKAMFAHTPTSHSHSPLTPVRNHTPMLATKRTFALASTPLSSPSRDRLPSSRRSGGLNNRVYPSNRRSASTSTNNVRLRELSFSMYEQPTVGVRDTIRPPWSGGPNRMGTDVSDERTKIPEGPPRKKPKNGRRMLLQDEMPVETQALTQNAVHLFDDF